jgi:two-component system LytT family sensor kinase
VEIGLKARIADANRVSAVTERIRAPRPLGYTEASSSAPLIVMETRLSHLFSENDPSPNRPLLAYAVSFSYWVASALFLATSSYIVGRITGEGRRDFWDALQLPLLNFTIAAAISPIFYYYAKRFPFEKGNWARRIPLHIAGGLAFTAIHMAIRVLAAYFVPIKNQMTGVVYAPSWDLFERMFLWGIYQDALGTYMPIVVVAHLVMLHHRAKARELRTAHLETRLAHSQLDMLKMQLHPHFLFNTLNAISALMHRDTKAAEEMLAGLSDLLRLTLDNAAVQEVTLKSELEFTGRYLEIEQVRFADRLKVHFDIDPETLDALVPNMVLQPLVENAVRHGIAPRDRSGTVEVIARREGDRLHLSVLDDGPGLPPGFNWQNGNGNGTSKKQGLGLENTRARLQQLYGSEQSLQLENVAGGGLRVNVSLPYRAAVQVED